MNTSLADAVATWIPVARGVSDAAMETDVPWRDRVTDVRWAFYRTYEELRDLANATAADRAAAGSSATTAQRALALYHVAHRDLQAVLLQAGEDAFDRVPAEGEWPLRSVLEHTMRAGAGFLALTNWALARYRSGDGKPLRMPEEESAPYRAMAAVSGTMAAVLARNDALHNRVLEELAGVAETELQAHVSFWYEADVRFQLYRFDAHLREHTIQAEKVIEAIAPRPADGLRTLRLIYRALGEAEGAAIGAPAAAAERQHEAAAAIAQRASAIAALCGLHG
jgi:hypothetical protein